MAHNLEQHHAFHDGFEAIEQYFREVQKDPKTYNCHKVISLLNKFGPIFLQHLNDEIETLAPEKMRLIFKDPMEAKAIDKKMVQWIVSTAPATTQVPFVFSLQNILTIGYDAPRYRHVSMVARARYPVDCHFPRAVHFSVVASQVLSTWWVLLTAKLLAVEPMFIYWCFETRCLRGHDQIQ